MDIRIEVHFLSLSRMVLRRRTRNRKVVLLSHGLRMDRLRLSSLRSLRHRLGFLPSLGRLFPTALLPLCRHVSARWGHLGQVGRGIDVNGKRRLLLSALLRDAVDAHFIWTAGRLCRHGDWRVDRIARRRHGEHGGR